MKAITFNRVVWIAAIALLLVYFFLDPETPGFPRCPVLVFTGWKCPGCGSQRAFHQLLQGNLQQAMSYNLLFIPALVYAGIGWLLENSSLGSRFPELRRKAYGFHAILLVLGITVTYGVARNLM
ncbi:MAG TPA: DUF2752 domain-containing protein [Saprospiraceae bacterium]|nr:DUF2752 domain-containing protein [Saprospiraceae bacterium]